jgi:hypothetical protein
MKRMKSGMPAWALFVGPPLLIFAIMVVGFRIDYDSVIPEVAAMVMIGFLLVLFNRPQRAWLWLLGLAAAFILSAALPPPLLNGTPSPEHIARYGPPKPSASPLLDSLRLWAFPAAGTALGIVCRLAFRALDGFGG